MSDMDDFVASYANYQKALAEANVVNKEALFDALSQAGITRVLADFDGEGDQGQINNIAAYCGEEPRELPDLTVELQHVSLGSDKRHVRRRSLREAVEEACYGYLSQEHDGWENNDGAFGEFSFDVAERRIELEFNGRFSDVTTSCHTF